MKLYLCQKTRDVDEGKEKSKEEKESMIKWKIKTKLSVPTFSP